MKRLSILILACVMCAFGQTPAATGAPPEPLAQNWIGAGMAWNQSATPQLNGWASYATLLSRSGQVYSFSTYDVTPIQVAGKYTVQTSTRTGLAVIVRTLGPITILGMADAGVSATSLTTGSAFSGGGIGVYKLGKTEWTIEAGARLLKTNGGQQTMYEFGFGRTL
jgi:hypothetical protein